MRRTRARWSGAAQPAGRRRSLALISVLFAGALLGADDVTAQNLEDYDYENLSLRAIGVDVVWANAKDAKGTVGFGIRADLSPLGPQVRVVPRFAYWKADIEEQAVAKFEENLEGLCTPPGCNIDLGNMQRNYWILGFDLQWVLSNPLIAPYLGVGADLYILDDSGQAIKGTFLDDAVVTAGLSAVGGVQFDPGKHLRLYADVRGTLVTSASNLAVYAGVAYRF
jgi:hypothetical protein